VSADHRQAFEELVAHRHVLQRFPLHAVHDHPKF
jgi:hypothetical protein